MSNIMRISGAELTESGREENLEALKSAHDTLPVASPVAKLLQQLINSLEHGSSFTGIVDEQDLSPNEAARLLGISRPHLMEKYVRTGLLTATKVGSHYRISSSAIADFIERRDQAARDVAVAIAARHNGSALDLSDDDLKELDNL